MKHSVQHSEDMPFQTSPFLSAPDAHSRNMITSCRFLEWVWQWWHRFGNSAVTLVDSHLLDSRGDQSKASISVVVPNSPTVQIMLITILFESKMHNMACVRAYAGTSIWIIIHTITDMQLLDRFLQAVQDFYLNANLKIHIKYLVDLFWI